MACSGTPWCLVVVGHFWGGLTPGRVHRGASRRHTHLLTARADTARHGTTQTTLLPAAVRGVMSNAKAGGREGPGKPGCRRG